LGGKQVAKGIIRKIDEQGRVVIPIEIRRAAGAMDRERFNLYFEDGVIHLSKGQGRRLDELGRYTIPKELRRVNGWETEQPMDVFLEGDEICIRKFGCEWCEETEDLIEVDGHRICHTCAEKVGAAIKKEASV
jgi:bifunctional DNA-binding transcriptional regulator/antitoxin component of YhaV-PrlF toxin-antitoxin module